jgi:hypothetical protein
MKKKIILYLFFVFIITGMINIPLEVNSAVAGPNQPPTVSIIPPSPINNSVVGPNFTLYWLGSDSDGWITSYEIHLDGAPYATALSNTTTSYNISGYGPGLHQVHVRARDDAAMMNMSGQLWFNFPLNQPPTVSIIPPSPINNSVVGPNFTLYWSGSDSDGWITSYEIHLDGAPYATALSNTTTSYNIGGYGPGLHQVHVRAHDDAAMINMSGQLWFNFPPTSNQPPTVSITSPLNNSVVGSNFTFFWSGFDSDGWISSYNISLNGGFYASVSNTTTSYNIGGYGTGWHQVQVQAKDNGGMINSSSQLWFYYPGNQPPSVSITSPLNNSVVGPNFTLYWSGSDSDGWISYYEIYLDSLPYTTAVSNTTVSFNIVGYDIGLHQIQVWAFDDGGMMNMSDQLWFNFPTIVNQAPWVIITTPSPANNTNVGSSFDLYWSGSDSDGWISSYNISLDGSYYATVSNTTTSYNVSGYSTGWHYVQIYAKDNGGLVNSSGQLWFYYPGIEPPTVNQAPWVIITSPSPANNSNVGSNFNLYWSGGDSDGWISSYSIHLNGAHYASVSNTTTTYNIGGYGTGWHQVQVKAYDNGSMTNSSGQLWFYYPGNQPPTVYFTNPTNNSNVGSNFTFYWWGSDSDGWISSYSIYLNGVFYASVSNTSTSYNIGAYGTGWHQVEVHTTDNGGR